MVLVLINVICFYLANYYEYVCVFVCVLIGILNGN